MKQAIMSWEDKDPQCVYEYALVSMVGPEMPQRAKINGIKVRGVGTLEECRKRAQELHDHDAKKNTAVDSYVIEMGRWLPLTLTTKEARDAGMTLDFQESRLQEFFDEMRKNKDKYDDDMANRKQALRAGRVPKKELMNDLEKMEKESQELRERMEHLKSLIEKRQDE